MILFFTGTGNSEYVARGLAEQLNDSCVSLNRYLKDGLEPVFESESPFVIVAPIYAWRIPRVIEDLIRRGTFTGSRELYCVGTMAAQSGDADRYCSLAAEENGMLFMGFRGVEMPSNFILGGPIPSPGLVNRTLRNALPVTREIADSIRSGEKLHKTDKTRFSRLMSRVVNEGFNKYMVSRQTFTVEDSCTGCGQCVEGCPVNNIRLELDKPVFTDRCLCCYACLHHCPAQAINIGPQTRNRGRYVCPTYPNT